METKITYNDTFDVANFMGLTKAIAEGFFDNGTYSPGYGKINAMRLFYNICVTESPFDIPHDIDTDIDMNPLLESRDFVKAFESALEVESEFLLTFGNAYKNALEIVNNKKGSLLQVVETLISSIGDLLDGFTQTISDDKLEKLETIASEVSNGNLDAKKLMKIFEKTKFKE